MRRHMTPVTYGLAALALSATPALAEPPVQTQWGVVSEPSYPSHICATLPAGITSRNLSIDAFDADGRNTHPDTARLQAAMDACKAGAVKLVRGPKGEDGLLTGPLTLRSGVTLWVDKGVTLYASRDPADYDVGPHDCGTASKESHKSCRALFEGTNLDQAGIVGEGRIDGRAGSLLLSGVNKGRMSWWDVAWRSKEGLVQHVPRLLVTTGGKDLTLYRITFENSPNFHLVPGQMTGVVAWGIKILSPSLEYTRPNYDCPAGTTPDKVTPAICFTPDTVKNTDGFDPANSSHVLLAYSWISVGDDQVAIKAGGKILSKDQTYAHNHFYYGHGMSVGSETNGGLQGLHVVDLIMDGKDSPNGNGLRIKSDASRGGLVKDVLYEQVCMRNTAHPLVFDAYYSDKAGALLPDFQGITVRDFHYVGGGKYGGGILNFHGYRDAGQLRPIGLSLEDIWFEGPAPQLSSKHGGAPDGQAVAVHFNLRQVMPGDLIKAAPDRDVTVHTDTPAGVRIVTPCTGVFVPMNSAVADAPI